MSRQESMNNRHHGVAHWPGINCNHNCTQVSSSDNDSDAQMTRLLTCYAYEQQMVVDVNPEMVDYTSVNNNGHTHHPVGQLQTASRDTYTSSQIAAVEGCTAVACRNLQKEKPRHNHFLNSSHRTDINEDSSKWLVPMYKEHHRNGNRTRNHESHHSKTHDSERSVVKHNRQHRSSRTNDHYGKESAHTEKHKACTHHPKENTTHSRATSEDMNELQVNVEFEVDSSLSTCAAIQNVDVEGVVAVNTTVCQPPRRKDVKGSSYGAVGGHRCKERKGITAEEMNELDVCIESNVRMTYKKNDTDTQHVASHGKKHHGKRSSKNVTKNGPVTPVRTSASPTTDKSLTLNSELQLSFEFAQNKTNTLTDMKECCGKIRDEITAFQEHEDLLKVVKNKVGEMYFKMGQRNFNSDKTLHNLKSRKVIQGYEKTIIVKTKSNCAAKCNECKSKIKKDANVKSLQEKKYSSEPVLKQRSHTNEGETLSQSVSDYWDRGKAVTDRDVGIRKSTSGDWDIRGSTSEQEDELKDCTSSDWNRRASMPEQEAGISDSASSGWNRRAYMSEPEVEIRDSASSGWNRRESMSKQGVGIRDSASSSWNRRASISEQEVGIRDSASSSWNGRESMSKQDVGIRNSASSSWNRRELMSEQECGIRDSASSGWNRRASMSEQEVGIRDSASSGWNGRESMSKQEVGRRASSSSSWDREKPVPVEQDLGPVDRVSDDWTRPPSADVDVGLKYSTSNGLVTDEKHLDEMFPSSEDLKKEKSLSVEEDGEKYSTPTSTDGRDNMPNRDVETEEFPSNGWDIEESIPEEEGIGVVNLLPDDWDNSQEYKTDENNLGIEAPVSDDFDTEEPVQNDGDPTLQDHNEINPNQGKPDVETTKLVLDDNNKHKTMQAGKKLRKKKRVLKPPIKVEATQDGGRINIVDTVVDYLKRGIFLSSEDENLYRRRHLVSRRIGRDVLTGVGGIDASGISNENKDNDMRVSATEGNRDGANYEGLDRVPSFRSTLDETTTLVSRPQMDRLWNHGHTMVYLGDRVSYSEMPSNDKEITVSVPYSSENVQPLSTSNNMLDEVSAILKQIDLPYISKVGSDIRNQSDISIMPSSSQSAEYGATQVTNICSSGNVVPVGEFGVNFRREQPTVVSNATSSNVETSKKGEKSSFLQKIGCVLGALKHKFNFYKTFAAGKFNENVSPSSVKFETIASTASDKSVQIPNRNCSDKMHVNFLIKRENFGRSFTYGNEPQSYEKPIENGSLIHTEDYLFPSDGPHAIGNTDVLIEDGEPTVDSSNKRNRTSEGNFDSELNKTSHNREQNGNLVNSETVGLKTSHSKRNKHSSANVSVSVIDDDSQSSSSEECLSISDAESDVNEEQAARTIDAGPKEERVPFEGIRGYPTRFYPITMYCLCVLLLYLFWTTCYFNCTYTSYGIARRSNAWYCRLYRSVKDSGSYTPEINRAGHGKLFHPFRPW